MKKQETQNRDVYVTRNINMPSNFVEFVGPLRWKGYLSINSSH